MRWPFAWRSTVESLKTENFALQAQAAAAHVASVDAHTRATFWHEQLKDAQKRVMELIDAKRTSPETMAKVFEQWGSEEQAKFFNVYGALSSDWGSAKQPGTWNRCFQLAAMEPDLDDQGRALLIELAQYAEAPAK